MQVLATSSSTADLPLISSCQKTPVAFSFYPFIDPPIGAKVSLSSTMRVQNTTTFSLEFWAT